MGIQGNKRVGVLAKLALRESYTNTKTPYANIIYHVNKLHLRKKWQFCWINKFRANFMQYIQSKDCGLIRPSNRQAP